MFAGAIGGFAASFLAVRLLMTRLAAFAVDLPNDRSLHDRPVPRTGGIGVLLGAAVSLAFGAGSLLLPFSLCLALAVLSLLDDAYGVPAPARLAAHLAAATALVWYILTPMNLAEQLVMVLAVAWITNLYNFMDGADGLAAGMTVIGFGAYALGAGLAGHAALAALSLGVSAASAAFLLHNFHPAKIFLGDVGSIPLGFLAGALGVVGWRDDVWPLWFPLLAFAPFVGDATVTLVRRLLGRQRVWRAHREHYYQRMVRMGMGHRRTTLIGYGLMLVCATLALLGMTAPAAVQATVFCVGVALLFAVSLWVDARWRRFVADREA
jgi:UDP-N-acetylmuramyl pentapeptide phosphotransferase/UDP-N-acetylglucosamine-1-phosphate transferase